MAVTYHNACLAFLVWNSCVSLLFAPSSPAFGPVALLFGLESTFLLWWMEDGSLQPMDKLLVESALSSAELARLTDECAQAVRSDGSADASSALRDRVVRETHRLRAVNSRIATRTAELRRADRGDRGDNAGGALVAAAPLRGTSPSSADDAPAASLPPPALTERQQLKWLAQQEVRVSFFCLTAVLSRHPPGLSPLV